MLAPGFSEAARLTRLKFSDLEGFAADDHRAAFDVFVRQAAAILEERTPLRPAQPASLALKTVCRAALAQPELPADVTRRFFEDHFIPFRIDPVEGAGGFATGYYEPIALGSLTRTVTFTAPVLARPADLVTLPLGTTLPGHDPRLSAARRLPDGTLVPYSDRAAIEAAARCGEYEPLVWLADSVDVFFAQVQGSARVVLPDGRPVRLVYAGRNGWPYTSIGRLATERGAIPSGQIGLGTLKSWLRSQGLGSGEPGAAHMLRNKSYIFFKIDGNLLEADGPIGGAGLSLSPLRSIAVDRSFWSYGLPFWLSGRMPWESEVATPLRRLMIAEDTGSAIVGPARFDIFFGSGEGAGECAGGIRHACEATVLLPCGEIG